MKLSTTTVFLTAIPVPASAWEVVVRTYVSPNGGGSTYGQFKNSGQCINYNPNPNGGYPGSVAVYPAGYACLFYLGTGCTNNNQYCNGKLQGYPYGYGAGLRNTDKDACMKYTRSFFCYKNN